MVLQINLQHSKAATAALARRIQVEKIELVLIQEPWASKGRIHGLGNLGGKLIFDKNSERARACIYVSNNLLHLPLLEFCSRDIAATKIKIPMGNKNTEVVIASVYLPFDLPLPTPEVEQLTNYCKRSQQHLIVGSDANAHHTTWGSSDTNNRGEYLLEFLLRENLIVLNSGNDPTFANRVRSEVIDITWATPAISRYVKGWHVSKEPSLSDHKHILFKISNAREEKITYRNPRKTDWGKYRENLKVSLDCVGKIERGTQGLNKSASLIIETMISSYNLSCPLITKKSNNKVKWWNSELTMLRKKTRHAFNKAKTDGQWEIYKETLTKYNKAIRRAKRNAWKTFCQEIESTTTCSRLNKVLSKDPINPIGTLQYPDGSYTKTGKETLDILLGAHFPGSTSIQSTMTAQEDKEAFSATRQSWKLAKEVVTYSRIQWAIRSFSPFKAAGVDNVIPALLQEGAEILTPHLLQLYRASIAYGYIPICWRKVKVVFIPKPGKSSYTQAKAYRPISLSSFMLKTLEKLVDRFIRERSPSCEPFSKYQHAYQSGKSCQTALHEIVSRVEKSLNNKEIALGVFLDIEGAFDNTSYKSINEALLNKQISPTLNKWVSSMLKSRQILASVFGDTVAVTATRGCPQGGVLSPLLWNLVVDELLANLNSRSGLYAQGYADDIVIICQGKFMETCIDLTQRGLNEVQLWCDQKGLRANPDKSVVMHFTRKVTKGPIRALKLFGKELNVSKEVKYLGLNQDTKLNWNKHLNKAIDRAKTSLMMARRTCSQSWGLQPKLMLWLYTAVIRPSITYGALLWWPKVQQESAKAKLTSLQRLATICTTGAMRSTSSIILEAILNLTPLDIFVMGEARLEASRIQTIKWGTNNLGHLKIMKIIQDDILIMMSDRLNPVYDFNRQYKTVIQDREHFSNYPHAPSHGTVLYTDGSKSTSSTGLGITGIRPRVSISLNLGQYASVFQAELAAIYTCALEMRGSKGQIIHILSDSQAAIMALNAAVFKSKLAWECHCLLNELGTSNKVTVTWVPGHMGIKGNEKADSLAKSAASNKMVGPEPTFGIPYSQVRRAVTGWTHKQLLWRWKNTTGNRHGKRVLLKPSPSIAAKLLKLKREDIRKVVGLITGHCHSRKHLQTVGVTQSTLECRYCKENEETATHLLFECPALARERLNVFNEPVLALIPQDDLIQNILDFINKSRLLGR